MATKRRALDEQISDLQAKEKQINERIKKLKAKQSEEERKKRAKRLIEIGASVESVLGRPIEKENLPKLISFLQKQEERGKYFSKAMSDTP